MTRTSHIAVLTAQLAIDGNSFQLLPAGQFKATDGRPGPGKRWQLDATIAARLIANSAKANDFVVDYEHQTLLTEQNGQPAPAAGWFSGLEWRDGQGLYATGVRWNARAQQMIADGEYRYISAVFSYDAQGRPTRLLHAGLTNNPALDGLAPVAALRFAHPTHHLEDSMNRAELLALLGLPDTATDEQISSGLAALKARATSADQLQTEVAALKATPANPDPAKFVPLAVATDLQQQIAALTTRINGSETDELIAAALADGRLLPAMEGWARELAKSDLAALRNYVAAAQPIAALKGQQTSGKQPAGDPPGELSADELAVCRAMGLSVEDYRKANPVT